jgi:hypothetical protein
MDDDDISEIEIVTNACKQILQRSDTPLECPSRSTCLSASAPMRCYGP